MTGAEARGDSDEDEDGRHIRQKDLQMMNPQVGSVILQAQVVVVGLMSERTDERYVEVKGKVGDDAKMLAETWVTRRVASAKANPRLEVSGVEAQGSTGSEADRKVLH